VSCIKVSLLTYLPVIFGGALLQPVGDVPRPPDSLLSPCVEIGRGTAPGLKAISLSLCTSSTTSLFRPIRRGTGAHETRLLELGPDPTSVPGKGADAQKLPVDHSDYQSFYGALYRLGGHLSERRELSEYE
jgi:hypothetical protein